MLLGGSVLGSSPLASLGIDPAFGAGAALQMESITTGPQYPAAASTGPQYEATTEINEG